MDKTAVAWQFDTTVPRTDPRGLNPVIVTLARPVQERLALIVPGGLLKLICFVAFGLSVPVKEVVAA